MGACYHCFCKISGISITIISHQIAYRDITACKKISIVANCKTPLTQNLGYGIVKSNSNGKVYVTILL